MVIQIIFFNFVISKEYDEIIKEKLVTVQYYISKDENLLKEFKRLKKENLKKFEEKAKLQEQAREKINKNLYLYYCIIPILCLLFVFIVFNLVFKFSNSLTEIQWINFLLVIFVYTPEVIIFLYVVKKYQYIGNVEILSKIYNNLTNK
jgi:C4-dicarboxylate transporter